MNKKAEKFQAMLDEREIKAFSFDELQDEDFHAVVFNSQMEVQKQLLQMHVILDDSIYAMIRIFVAPRIATEETKGKIAAYLNEFNKKYKVFKYYISDEGDIVLDCCLTVANDDTFEPQLVTSIIDVALNHLQEQYPEIMKNLWAAK